MKKDNSKHHIVINEVVLNAVNANKPIYDYEIARATGIDNQIVAMQLVSIRRQGLIFKSSRSFYWPTQEQADIDTEIYGKVPTRDMAAFRTLGTPLRTKIERKGSNERASDLFMLKSKVKTQKEKPVIVWPETVVVTVVPTAKVARYTSELKKSIRPGAYDHLKY